MNKIRILLKTKTSWWSGHGICIVIGIHRLGSMNVCMTIHIRALNNDSAVCHNVMQQHLLKATLLWVIYITIYNISIYFDCTNSSYVHMHSTALLSQNQQ